MQIPRLITLATALTLSVTAPRIASAQLADTKVLTTDAVKSLLASAEATAKQNKWLVSIAVTDAAGDLLGFLKLDNASTGSVQIAQGKARTAARFGRPTKVYADRVLTDTLTFLSVDGLVALQGGLPITVNGKVIGAVGVSGATSAQDEQVAATAIAAVIKP
ncbi:MAG: heme-binding protein [Gemmatimonadota bacterium]|nr:heme-binding protein [Gemmatimonadota bacterium]MDQ8167953.1 heme-binding protein [Gemmatimonadota bacterium]MDQ8172066.1 heme-binding protein [Gemmatimonadota bacterium]